MARTNSGTVGDIRSPEQKTTSTFGPKPAEPATYRPTSSPGEIGILGLADLITACRQLRNEEIGPALQDRYLPIRHLSPEPFIVATDELSIASAREAGHAVGAVAGRRDLSRALQIAFGKWLISRATTQLERRHPIFSARSEGGRGRKCSICLAAILAIAGLIASIDILGALAGLLISLGYLAVISVRLVTLGNLRQATERPRTRLKANELPIYTVLVPMFRETKSLRKLIGALNRLDYPADRLDIKLILEEEDQEMRRAVANLDLAQPYETIIVPKGLPQTKPRALKYALYYARGELLTVFDAEDVPQPGQLRRAAEIFAAAPARLACLQARLTFERTHQNWLAKQFLIEYAALFDVVLPAFGFERWPIPLGGTSNHFRTDILRDVGAWDPFNVTEDADLGLRLARCGFEVDTFAASTLEEANTSLSNWMRQRSRWMKGWLQTTLVHLRHPRQLLHDLGAYRFFIVIVQLVGMVVSPLVHPFFPALVVWVLLRTSGESHGGDFFVSAATGLSAVVCIGGYWTAVACQVKGIQQRRFKGMMLSTLTMPFYWLLISIAAWLAVWEFMRRPYHWNKTEHGLAQRKTGKLERAKGIEPSTSSLGSLRSTTELRPRAYARGGSSRKNSLLTEGHRKAPDQRGAGSQLRTMPP